MSLSTPLVNASSKTTTQPLAEKPVDSSFSDVVKIALPVIAMLAAFVFLPVEGAILCTGLIIGLYIYNDGPSNKPLEKASDNVPATPATPNNEAPELRNTESAKKKHKTPSSSARKSARVAESYITPKSPANPKLSTPIQPKSEAPKSVQPAERFSREAKLRARQSSESSDDDDEQTSSPVRQKPLTPAQPKSVTPKTTPAQTPAKQRTPLAAQPPNTPFVERFGPNPRALKFSPHPDDLVPLTERVSTPPSPPVSTPEVFDSPYFSPQVSPDPLETKPQIQLPKRPSLLSVIDQHYPPSSSKPHVPDSRSEASESDGDSESSSSEVISVSVKHTPKLDESLPPRHPRSNRATNLRTRAIAEKLKGTPKSRKRGSSHTPVPLSSKKESTRVSSTRTPHAKTPASSESEHSDTPPRSKKTPRWNSSTNPNSK